MYHRSRVEAVTIASAYLKLEICCKPNDNKPSVGDFRSVGFSLNSDLVSMSLGTNASPNLESSQNLASSGIERLYRPIIYGIVANGLVKVVHSVT